MGSWLWVVGLFFSSCVLRTAATVYKLSTHLPLLLLLNYSSTDVGYCCSGGLVAAAVQGGRADRLGRVPVRWCVGGWVARSIG